MAPLGVIGLRVFEGLYRDNGKEHGNYWVSLHKRSLQQGL